MKYLSGSGYPTKTLRSFRDLRNALSGVPSDVIVLDLPLFGYDSIEEVSELSQNWAQYIVVLGEDEQGIDRVAALEAGADYFLYKDVSPREVLAVLRAIRRRTGRKKFARAATEFKFDGFVFEAEQNQLIGPSGRRVLLTLTELALLRMFLASRERPLSREDLAAALPPVASDRLNRAVDSHVSRLRRKLGYQTKSNIILTIPGRGYAFGAEVLEVERVDQAA